MKVKVELGKIPNLKNPKFQFSQKCRDWNLGFYYFNICFLFTLHLLQIPF